MNNNIQDWNVDAVKEWVHSDSVEHVLNTPLHELVRVGLHTNYICMDRILNSEDLKIDCGSWLFPQKLKTSYGELVVNVFQPELISKSVVSTSLCVVRGVTPRPRQLVMCYCLAKRVRVRCWSRVFFRWTPSKRSFLALCSRLWWEDRCAWGMTLWSLWRSRNQKI